MNCDYLINLNYNKIYLGRLEQSNDRVYAIKIMKKIQNGVVSQLGAFKLLESNLIEKEVGFLGHQCRFITKLFAAFNNSVTI